MWRALTYSLLIVGLTVTLAFGQGASFEASVDKNPVSQSDQFTLSFVLNNAGMGGGKNLQPPDLSRFHIMGGPNQSTSMQFVNGVVSSSVTYGYVLQPKEVGKFTIGSASIEAGGKVYKSEPITLEVVKGTAPPKQRANAPNDLSNQIGDNLFLRATADRMHVLQGEQINVTFKLYTRISVSNYAIDKNPAMTGFWSEEIENPKNIALANETINGKQYRVGVIRRLALFPTQAGTLELSPMEMQTTVQVQTRSRDPFDAFFRDPFGQTVNYKVKSEPLKFKVEPLPSGAPPGFKGAVGRFSMNTTVNKTTTRTNEPITLKITIAGTGNIKLLESPFVELPKDFEQYSPKVTESLNRTQEKISGTKVFEYLVLPRYPGQKVIKPVSFSYFDLSKHDYVTLNSSQIDLTVEQGTASTPPFIAGAPREDVRLLNQDIRFIRVANVALARQGEYLHTSGIFLVLLAFPLAGLVGAYIYSRQRQAVMMDEVGYRNRRALKVAQKGLKQAEQLLSKAVSSAASAPKLAFYTEISRALYKYLGDKLNIQQAEMSIEGTLAELAKRSVDGNLSTSLKSVLESCEMARFAPSSLGITAMQQAYENAKKVIIELERTLKSK
jgi:hypothetical protein